MSDLPSDQPKSVQDAGPASGTAAGAGCPGTQPPVQQVCRAVRGGGHACAAWPTAFSTSGSTIRNIRLRSSAFSASRPRLRPPRSASSSGKSKASSGGRRSCRGRPARSSSGGSMPCGCCARSPPSPSCRSSMPRGKERLRVSRLAMDVVGSGTDYSKDPKFTEAMARKVYYGPVYFRRESEPYMTLAIAGTRRDAGVSVAEVNLKLIWDVVSQIKVGEHGNAYVVDAQGRLIAHPDISLVLRNTDMSNLAQVKSARAGAAGESAEVVQEARNIQGREVLTASAPVPQLGWLMFVELPAEEAYAPLYAAFRRLAFILLAALAFAVLSGMFLARRMVGPIQALQAGAARIGSGDLCAAHLDQDRRRAGRARRSVQRDGRAAGGILCGPGREGGGAHARACPVGRRADGAWRGHPRGQLDARSRNAALHHRCQGRRALRHRRRRRLGAGPGNRRTAAARDLRNEPRAHRRHAAARRRASTRS